MKRLSFDELLDIKDYYFCKIPVSDEAKKEREWIIKLVKEVEIRRGLIDDVLEEE